jgi:hypothetical protein
VSSWWSFSRIAPAHAGSTSLPRQPSHAPDGERHLRRSRSVQRSLCGAPHNERDLVRERVKSGLRCGHAMCRSRDRTPPDLQGFVSEARVRTPLKESYARCPFREGGVPGIATDDGAGWHGLTERKGGFPGTLLELIAQGADLLRTGRDLPPMHAIDLNAVRILPPVPKPPKMLCVGLN